MPRCREPRQCQCRSSGHSAPFVFSANYGGKSSLYSQCLPRSDFRPKARSYVAPGSEITETITDTMSQQQYGPPPPQGYYPPPGGQGYPPPQPVSRIRRLSRGTNPHIFFRCSTSRHPRLKRRATAVSTPVSLPCAVVGFAARPANAVWNASTVVVNHGTNTTII
ncbi:hypothetical protein BKA56DRAFT_589563 [Ilyonectria sp. MPI-CAGE-AT-0026]|nr:hypothetical protein BKA56DRAFT_589563 [Ilyonectria sp. MPI-CAGE-AT-0026]